MNSDDRLKFWVYDEANKKYIKGLPTFAKERLEWELEQTVRNGHSHEYINAALAVKSIHALATEKYNVASSFVAYLIGITELNPLPSHYYCEECGYAEVNDNVRSGLALSDKKCPLCGNALKKDGFGFYVETFMGVDGTMRPHIEFDFIIDNPNISKILDMVSLDDVANMRRSDEVSLNDKETYEFIANGCLDNLKVYKYDETADIIKTVGVSSFEDLIRISAMSMGKGVWEAFLKYHKLGLDLPTTRDDVTSYLIKHGFDRQSAFKISEPVRMGRKLTDEQIAIMKNNGIEDLFIEYCNSVEYLVARAYAATNALFLYRVAYEKIHNIIGSNSVWEL